MQTVSVRNAKSIIRVSVAWGCEMRTGKNKSGPDPGAKCEMLAKNPDEPSVRKFEMRNVSLSRRVLHIAALHVTKRICCGEVSDFICSRHGASGADPLFPSSGTVI